MAQSKSGTVVCDDCGGKGYHSKPGDKCQTCKGRGYLMPSGAPITKKKSTFFEYIKFIIFLGIAYLAWEMYLKGVILK